MSQRLFLVDVESTGPSPFSAVMTEFGVVDFETRNWFHGIVHDSMPSKNNPALPVLSGRDIGSRFAATMNGYENNPNNAWFDQVLFDGDLHTVDGEKHDNEHFLYATFNLWLQGICNGLNTEPTHSGNDQSHQGQSNNKSKNRPVFVSDNPGFDFMWIAEAFDRNGLKNPFGHSSRRIGDLAAGLSGNWKQTSKWKKRRKTSHDHNPVNDSMGNAEALDYLLKEHGQK